MARRSRTESSAVTDENPTAKSKGVILPSDVESVMSSKNVTRAEAERHLFGGEDLDEIKGGRVTFYSVVEARPASDEHPLKQADDIQARNLEAARTAALGAEPVIVGPTATVMGSSKDARKVEEGDKAEGEPAVTVTL